MSVGPSISPSVGVKKYENSICDDVVFAVGVWVGAGIGAGIGVGVGVGVKKRLSSILNALLGRQVDLPASRARPSIGANTATAATTAAATGATGAAFRVTIFILGSRVLTRLEASPLKRPIIRTK